MTRKILPPRLLPSVLLCGLLSACAGNPVLEQSRADLAAGRHQEALARLEEASRAAPTDAELRAEYIRVRDQLVRERIAAADQAHLRGNDAEAERQLDQVLSIEPENPRALAGRDALLADRRNAARLDEAAKLLAAGDAAGAERLVRAAAAESPGNPRARALLHDVQYALDARSSGAAQALGGAFAKPVTLEFRDAPLRLVFEALSRASGLNFVFDSDVRADARVTLFVRNSSVDEVIRLLAATQGIERKILNANSVLIYPSTPAKQKSYQDLVTRAFYLAYADVKQAQTMVRQLVKTRDVFIDDKINLMVVKDTPEAVRLTERLVAALDVADPEVVLEVEVLEISRNKLTQLGLDFPDQVGYGLLTPTVSNTVTTNTSTTTSTALGGTLLPGNVNLRSTGSLVPFVANPALVLNLKKDDGDTRLLANPRIRVKNREKAKVHIGDKLPVFTTTATANVGVSASVNYLDVGLKLEVEPAVSLDDDVAIKVGLEVSSISKEVTGPSGSLAYQVGTRSAGTVLQLHDGETQVLAGLISDEERNSANRVPGLGDLPVLGRLFSNERSSGSSTEIVLLITPRVVRNIVAPASFRADLPAGTERDVGVAPLSLGPTAPGSLALRREGPPSAPRPGIVPSRTFPSMPAVVPAGPSVRAALLPEASSGSANAVAVALIVTATESLDPGTIDVRYDPARLEPAGMTVVEPGHATVEFPGGEGEIPIGLSFTVKAGTAGPTRVSVSGLTTGDGSKLPLAASTMVGATP
jgi:general secretion pathway protein D